MEPMSTSSKIPLGDPTSTTWPKYPRCFSWSVVRLRVPRRRRASGTLSSVSPSKDNQSCLVSSFSIP